MPTSKKQLTTCQPKTAVAYARYSSANQRDVSIEQQLRDIRAYAEREGYTIIYEYSDHAKSGFKNVERRTQFQAMIQAAASGAFDTVIAWKVDRFGRNRRESATFKGQLADCGVKVVYAMEPIPDGAAGVLTEGMLESLAEWYSRNISENTKRGQHDNAVKGLYNGHASYGYRRSADNRFEIYEPEAAVVRKIFDLYAQGHSFASIVRILADDGVLTKNGRPFQKATVLYILTNDNYIGTYHYADVRIQNSMPAIIDIDVWEQCQLQRKKTYRSHKWAPEDYYLSGRCTCGLCGAPIYGAYGSGRNGKRYQYYHCKNMKNIADRCISHYMRKEALEQPVLNFLFNKILTGDLLDSFVDAVSDVLKARRETSPKQKLEADLRDTTRKIDNITRAISEGIWTKQTAAMLEDLNKRAEELQQKIAYHQMTDDKIISSDRIRFLMHKVAEGKRDDPEYLKALIGVLVNSVTVYDHWLRVVINAAENVGQIPPEDLPPLEVLPDGNRFEFRSVIARSLYVVEPYPVIVFKIAI